MGTSGGNNGPGYADVADFLIELGRTWGGLHTFTIAPDRDRRGIPNLFIVLKHSPPFGDGGNDGTKRAWASWPDSSSRTLSGLMFKLCYELDGKLGKMKVEREAQTKF